MPVWPRRDDDGRYWSARVPPAGCAAPHVAAAMRPARSRPPRRRFARAYDRKRDRDDVLPPLCLALRTGRFRSENEKYVTVMDGLASELPDC